MTLLFLIVTGLRLILCPSYELKMKMRVVLERATEKDEGEIRKRAQAKKICPNEDKSQKESEERVSLKFVR